MQEYDVSVTFTDNLFLVDLVNNTDGVALALDSIQGGKEWLGMDVLIFNSWHWWIRSGQGQPWNYIQIGNQKFKDMDRLDAYSKGMSTWSKWVDTNIDPAKTKVFFQGISPIHYDGHLWGQPNAKTCTEQTKPLSGSTYPGGPVPSQGVVKSVLGKMSKPVTLLDLTLLSQLRVDAHPSKYEGIHSNNDCSHWCLAGLPDTWNQLLYAELVL
ncbi:hypothetical protein QJS04_geneDACA011002 [Acorus gramineus]|uniref:Trichome birefringence-like C-terminal domain-containing protein n=1 Tax=Acorus gramineus TaxID=55184 RepID=A0AAV9BFH8_ACOGR|nr:hypothetical protein QJS04_geneDACA011002 [Acorus gramineus]